MDNTLAHYGILGMKWGVRRFQNRDGSLTAAGRKRYDDDGPGSSANPSSSTKSVSSTSRSSGQKSISEMSDEELRAAVQRLQLERQYRDLLPKEQKTVSKGRQFAVNVLKKVGNAALESGTNVLKEYTTAKLKSKLGLNEKKSEEDKRKSYAEKLKREVEILNNEETYKKKTGKDYK